jgi:hypothetical protein
MLTPLTLLDQSKGKRQEPQTDNATRSRSLEDECQSKSDDGDKDIGISPDYLRSLEKQVKSDKK